MTNKITIDKALLEQAISALLREALGVDNSALRQKLRAALEEPVVEPATKAMTAHRAAYLMERFKKEEKLLGPNEQAAVDFVIDMLTSQHTAPPPAVEPVAWMTFDGEGGYDLRLYDMNESYRNDYIKRNGEKYASWVQPLYASPPAEPVLEDIEQYRLQMAGISTAAFGYWKAGDGIHPDYDTLALRDVAKLYAKYDTLYKASPPAEHSCKFPICQTEKYQQDLADQLARELIGTPPADVPLLTDDEIDACYDAARISFRQHQSKVRGQQIMPPDGFDWHFARATEAKVRQKVGL